MRLTKKGISNLLVCNKEYANAMYNKLCQYEDIEEELGIDLVTLFKAFENGVYYKLESGTYIKFKGCLYKKPHKLNVNLKNKSLSSGNYNYYFKDYGKTWALTKEELE